MQTNARCDEVHIKFFSTAISIVQKIAWKRVLEFQQDAKL